MKLRNVAGRPVRPTAGGPSVAAGEVVDLNSRDSRIARMIDRGQLRQVRATPPPATADPQPDPQPEPPDLTANDVTSDNEE